MRVWSLLVPLLGVMRIGVGNPDGAPPAACVSMVPGHRDAMPMETESLYRLEVDRVTVYQGEEIMVSITGSESFRGFLLQARWADGRSTEALGRFVGRTDRERRIPCGGVMATGLTHSNRGMNDTVDARWVATRIDQGSVQFIATVVKSYDEFWVGIRSPSVTVATRTSTVALTTAEDLRTSPPDSLSTTLTPSWSLPPSVATLLSTTSRMHQTQISLTTPVGSDLTTPGVSSTPPETGVGATTASETTDPATATRLSMTTDDYILTSATTIQTPYVDTIPTTEKGVPTTPDFVTQLPGEFSTTVSTVVDVETTLYRITKNTTNYTEITTQISSTRTDENSTLFASTSNLQSSFLNTTVKDSLESTTYLSTEISNTMATDGLSTPFSLNSEPTSVDEELTTESSTTFHADNSTNSYDKTSTLSVDSSTALHDVVTTHLNAVTSTAASTTLVDVPTESSSTTITSSETLDSTPRKITLSETSTSLEYFMTTLSSSSPTRESEITSTSMPGQTINLTTTETTSGAKSTNLPFSTTPSFVAKSSSPATATQTASTMVNQDITTPRVILEQANEIRMRLRITGIPFTEGLKNSTSDEFRNAAGQIAKGIQDLYARQGVRTLRSVNVLQITSGSIVPEVQIISSETFNDSSKSAWLQVMYNEIDNEGRLGNFSVSDLLAIGSDGTFHKVGPCFLLPCPSSMNCNVSEGMCKSMCFFNVGYCLHSGVCTEPAGTMQLISCRCDQNHEGDRCDVSKKPVTPPSGENNAHYVIAAICGLIACVSCVIISIFSMWLIRHGKRERYWRRTTTLVSRESGLVSILNGREETNIDSGALFRALSDVRSSEGEGSHTAGHFRVASFDTEQPRFIEDGVYIGDVPVSLNRIPERDYEFESLNRHHRRSMNFSDVVEMSDFAALENFSLGSRDVTEGNFQMRWDFHVDRSDSRESTDL